jgi:hypothetical protein
MPFRQITQLNLISFLRHNIRRPLSHDCLGPATTWNTVLPKYFRGTIEKVEFDLGPAKTSAKDLQRVYLERFASAVRN